MDTKLLKPISPTLFGLNSDGSVPDHLLWQDDGISIPPIRRLKTGGPNLPPLPPERGGPEWGGGEGMSSGGHGVRNLLFAVAANVAVCAIVYGVTSYVENHRKKRNESNVDRVKNDPSRAAQAAVNLR